VEVGSFAVVVQDAQDLDGPVVTAHGVWSHGVEAGCFASGDEDLAVSET
jgi:hypothetical protein